MAMKSAPASASASASSSEAAKGDAGRFEQLRPPVGTLQRGIEGRPAAGDVGLAEHHIIGAELAGGHGVVLGAQPADAGDAMRADHGKRGLQGIGAVEMGAVGAEPVGERDVALDEAGGADGVGARHQRRQGGGVRRAGTQQDGGDVGRLSRGADGGEDDVTIRAVERRREEIEARLRARRCGIRSGHVQAVPHDGGESAASW